MDDGVGGGEVQAAAARLQADQKERRVAFLETLDQARPVLGPPGEL
jgi:hypothetical protein